MTAAPGEWGHPASPGADGGPDAARDGDARDGGAVLTVWDLAVHAGATPLVQDVGFTVRRGERLGLIGESGSGKSMTASAIMGLLPDDVGASGSVRLGAAGGGDPAGGRELLGARESELGRIRGRDMSMVFQEPMSALNPLMRVGRQVAEVMLIHRTVEGRAAARARSLELLAQVRLPDPAAAATAYPHQLSGGQRQRVMLAIALANNPGLLICDEPTTALDVTVQRQVLDLVLAEVAARDAGLLFITHDLAVVASVCERILVMHGGRVVEEGDVDKIFSAPEHPYTRGLLAASDLSATDARGRLFTVATAGEYRPPAAAASPSSFAGPAISSPAPDRSASTAIPRRENPGAENAASAPAPAVASPAPLISARGLNRVYTRSRTSLFSPAPTVQALKDVSFDVDAGQRFGIVGESGSGKSTLLRILAGLDRPTSGSITVAGTDVAKAGASELRAMRHDLQIVFQDPFASLDPRMKVHDIIAEPTLDQKMGAAERIDAVREVLHAVDLPEDSRERYPHQFSGGQRQRISIARALIRRPKILVADEPVSALDVSVRAQVLNVLADLVDEYSLTLVFVSHDLGVVRHLCSDVAVMRSGEVLETGPVDRVYDDPQHEYTRSLIAASPTLAGVLAARAQRTSGRS